jgi:hypothetical protein
LNEIEGQPGELLDRLVELLNSDALGEREWYSVSIWAEMFVGGRVFRQIVPDTGPPTPGSVNEMQRRRHQVVSREAYFKLLRERLGELTASGVEEAFLVRGLRHAIRQELESLADVRAAGRPSRPLLI